MEEILDPLKTRVESFELLPSTGGVFEVIVDGELIFSKKELARFPQEGEIIGRLEKVLA